MVTADPLLRGFYQGPICQYLLKYTISDDISTMMNSRDEIPIFFYVLRCLEIYCYIINSGFKKNLVKSNKKAICFSIVRAPSLPNDSNDIIAQSSNISPCKFHIFWWSLFYSTSSNAAYIWQVLEWGRTVYLGQYVTVLWRVLHNQGWHNWQTWLAEELQQQLSIPCYYTLPVCHYYSLRGFKGRET